MNDLLFDPCLFRALRKVARGEIGTTDWTGTLRHRTQELSPHLFSALYQLRRDAYVQLSAAGPDPRDGWITAELTPTGRSLLAGWASRFPPAPVSPAARHDTSHGRGRVPRAQVVS